MQEEIDRPKRREPSARDACPDEVERRAMEECIAMFEEVDNEWRFKGFATSVEICQEVGAKVVEENGYDTFRSFRLEH